MSHSQPSPLAGWTVTVYLDGQCRRVEVEDWAVRVTGRFPGRLYGHDADTRLACLFRVCEIVRCDL